MGQPQNRQRNNPAKPTQPIADPRPTFEEVVVRVSPQGTQRVVNSSRRSQPPQHPAGQIKPPRSQLSSSSTTETSPNSTPSAPRFTEEIRPGALAVVPKSPIAHDSTATAYTDKTQRITAWSGFLRSLQPFIWLAIVLIVIIPLVGKTLLFYFTSNDVQVTTRPLTEIIAPALPKKATFDQALVEAVQTAHQSAQAFARVELDDWELELEGRVDHFLDWYFGYFHQKKIEFATPWIWLSSSALHKLNPNQMTASEAVVANFTAAFQKQFAKQVLVPQTAQIRLENITTATIHHYLLALRQNLDQVQLQYRLPQGQWDRYLADISTTIQDTEGNLSNLSLKMLVGGSGYMVAKPLVLTTVGKVGSKVSAKLAGTAAAKVAAKTGGAVAAELGTSLVDPIVGVGIFIWDLWDYQHTVELERPLLRANLLDYLRSVEQSLLDAPETGVLSAIAQLEQGIFQAL